MVEKGELCSRTVMVPLFLLATLKPRACNPRCIGIRELFLVPPEQESRYLRNPTGRMLGKLFLILDHTGRIADPLFPSLLQRLGIARSMAFIKERLNGEDGLGGILPAMVYALMAFLALGYPRYHPDVVTTKRAIDKLLIFRKSEAYCQPCLSPVWDTGLAMHALLEAGVERNAGVVARGCEWLVDRQVLDVKGDWAANRGHVRPGGWAFQYRNAYYPDVDDTAVVVMALHRANGGSYDHAIARGCEWVIGMQSRNGGWGAFDADNEHSVLNNIPFADHGAQLHPATADVTARCLSMLAQLGYTRDHPTIVRGLTYLRGQQETDGSWFGRWGTNYIYGTWSVLCALNALDEDINAPCIRRAVGFLKSRQQADGGWGESCASYWPQRPGGGDLSLQPHDLVVAVVALALLQRRLGGQQSPISPFRQPRRRDVELPCHQLQRLASQQAAYCSQLPLRREALRRWPAGGLVSASFLGALQQVRRLLRALLHHSVHSALLPLRSV